MIPNPTWHMFLPLPFSSARWCSETQKSCVCVFFLLLNPTTDLLNTALSVRAALKKTFQETRYSSVKLPARQGKSASLAIHVSPDSLVADKRPREDVTCWGTG